MSGITGPTGPTGPQGPQGPQGVQGPQGLQGPTGLQGVAGPPGQTGSAGPTGPTGLQGPQGIQGPAGAQGPTGQQGLQGPAGVQGSIGPTGPQGPQGPTGAQGLQGSQGPTGPQGSQGPTGPQGPGGAQGPQGNQGPTGAQGAAGPTGPTGLQGPQGPQGNQGQTGPQGPQGPTGTFSTGAPIYSDLIPGTTDTYNLGSSSATWASVQVGSSGVRVYQSPGVMGVLVTPTTTLTLNTGGMVSSFGYQLTTADFLGGSQTTYGPRGVSSGYGLAGQANGATGPAVLTQLPAPDTRTVSTIRVRAYDLSTFDLVGALVDVDVVVYQGSSSTPFATASFLAGDSLSAATFTPITIPAADNLTAGLSDGQGFPTGTFIVILLDEQEI